MYLVRLAPQYHALIYLVVIKRFSSVILEVLDRLCALVHISQVVDIISIQVYLAMGETFSSKDSLQLVSAQTPTLLTTQVQMLCF